MINRCGYELGETNYEYYALDAETMQQQEIIADKAGDNSISEPREWNKEDDCYYFLQNRYMKGCQFIMEIRRFQMMELQTDLFRRCILPEEWRDYM